MSDWEIPHGKDDQGIFGWWKVMGVWRQGAKPVQRGVAEAGTQNAFPSESQAARVTLWSSSHEIPHRKMHFSRAANVWQHCFASVLPLRADTLMLVDSFSSTASFITLQRPQLSYFTNRSRFH